jgi:hypothetical protein
MRGIIYQKNVSHKNMRTSFTNPKIMVMTCPLDTSNQNENFHDIMK